MFNVSGNFLKVSKSENTLAETPGCRLKPTMHSKERTTFCMSNKIMLTALSLIWMFLFSCKGTYPESRYYSPVHAMYEKAGTLGKGRMEISGQYTANIVLGHNPNGQYHENENAFGNNVGLRFGYGFTDKVDVKLRYEHTSMPLVVEPSNQDFNSQRARNYFFSVMPKISLKAEKLALFVPLSFYDFTSKQPALSNYVFREKYFSFAPHVIRTFSVKTNKMDFSTSVNGEVVFLKDDYRSTLFSVFSGFNIGAGFSNNLAQWAVRPELGYNYRYFDQQGVWNFGVALQVMLPNNRKQKQ
jgi:hypothetical protein